MSKHRVKPLLVQVTSKLSKQEQRSHGQRTNEAYHSSAKGFCEFLRDRYGLQDIDNLKTKHVEAFFQERIDAGIGASQLGIDASVIRKIADAIGKQNIMPRTNKEVGFERPQSERHQPVQANREALDQVRQNLVDRAERTGDLKDKALVAAYDLRQEFGVRSKESITAHIVERHGDVFVRVMPAGAKGGRERELYADTPKKRAAAENYRVLSREMGNRDGKIIPRDMPTAKALYDYQRNQIRAAGGTKANGAHMHAQRHERAQSMHAEGATDHEISEHLGHGREEVIAHYVDKG